MEEKMRTSSVMIISTVIVFLTAAYARGQQSQSAGQRPLTPEQQAYRQWDARHQQLKDQGKQIFDAEMAREKAGDCPDANTTDDFNTCYGKQLDATEASLKSFEATIHGLLEPPPKMPGERAAPPPSAGGIPTAAQDIAEFESVEQSWRAYRDQACAAAFHQFQGGTGAPSFELECRLQLTRDHMRELKMIYGESFI
jgi:uncharacterized protein YecT (DUF1311 family)